MIKRIILGAALVILSTSVASKEFVVSYDGFYDRMKTMEKGQYSAAEVGFYLVDLNGKPCPLASGKIITEQREFALSFTPNAKLLLPFDETLDKDKAVIVATPIDPKMTCQLKLQIMSADNYYNSISKHQAFTLYQEFEDLIGGLSGFFMRTLFSFMMPEVEGVTLIFNDIAHYSGTDERIVCEGKRCVITPDENWHENKQSLQFNQEIVQVIPYIKK